LTPKPRNLFSRINRIIAAIIAGIMIFVVVGGYRYYSKVFLATETTDGSDVQTAVAQRGDLVLSASGTGTLIANSDATFGFETSGQVTDVYVKVGDQVEAGQVLAQLDSTLVQMNYVEAQQALQELYSAASIATIQQEIATAQDTEFYAHEWLKYLLSPEVIEAEENVAIAEQKLAEAQAEAKANPSDVADQNAKEKESAVTFLNEKLTQARAYYENEYLPANFGQYENVGSRRHPKQVLVTYIDPQTGEELPEIDGPSTDDIAIARNNYAQAQEIVKQGETFLEVLKAGVIPEGATGEKLNTLYGAQFALKKAKSALDATQLIAPTRGTVTSIDINVGEQGNISSAITISQLNQPYQLDTYIDGTDWSMAKIGNKVNVTFDLLPDTTFPGTVTLVYPELDSSSNSPLAHILVQLDKSISQNLPTGTGATVEVIGGEANNAILVPANAIHKTSNGGYAVYIIQNGRQVEQPVEIGLQGTAYVEIKSGPQAGTAVVTK
jgi:HlyD family secretion protein